MQCQQPLFGFGYPSPGQYFPSNPVNPFNGIAPEIIGEGEVNSITFPDGTIQYYFLPVRWQSDVYSKRWPPQPFNDNMYCNYYNRPNTGVWIIKHFTNTISPVYNEFWRRTNPDPFTKPCFSFERNVIPANFQLKFHNDSWTSTTDLRYFCPNVPPIATSQSAAVQVEIPKEIKCSCHSAASADPSSSTECAHSSKEKKSKSNRSVSRKLDKKHSSLMSIDKWKACSSCTLKKLKLKKSKQKILCSCYSNKRGTKKSNNLICENESQSSAIATDIVNNDQKQTNERNCDVICERVVFNNAPTAEVGGQVQFKSNADRECDVQSIADKAVATYNDQASNVKEVEGETQTGFWTNCSCSSIDMTTVSDVWIPKIYNRYQKNSPQSSEKLIGVYEISSSESNSTSCSNKTSRNSVK